MRNSLVCPRCPSTLTVEKFKDIEVDRCSTCKGMWLEYDELDRLEDRAMDDDEMKGSLMFRSFAGDLRCPTCDAEMQMFHYRAFNLELDFCPKQCGFWLDSGEEKRVLEIMKQRVKDLKRSEDAEAEWAGMLRRFKSKSFGDRMKGLFR